MQPLFQLFTDHIRIFYYRHTHTHTQSVRQYIISSACQCKVRVHGDRLWSDHNSTIILANKNALVLEKVFLDRLFFRVVNGSERALRQTQKQRENEFQVSSLHSPPTLPTDYTSKSPIGTSQSINQCKISEKELITPESLPLSTLS